MRICWHILICIKFSLRLENCIAFKCRHGQVRRWWVLRTWNELTLSIFLIIYMNWYWKKSPSGIIIFLILLIQLSEFSSDEHCPAKENIGSWLEYVITHNYKILFIFSRLNNKTPNFVHFLDLKQVPYQSKFKHWIPQQILVRICQNSCKVWMF